MKKDQRVFLLRQIFDNKGHILSFNRSREDERALIGNPYCYVTDQGCKSREEKEDLLEELVKEGYLDRTEFNRKFHPVEYCISDKGLEYIGEERIYKDYQSPYQHYTED